MLKHIGKHKMSKFVQEAANLNRYIINLEQTNKY